MRAAELVRHAVLRRLRARVAAGPVPRHVALVMDGNRRWARQQGFANVSVGHRSGAEHVEAVLGWCAALGVRHVTVFVASLDNLAKRDPEEVAFLMSVCEDVVADRLTRPGSRWQVHVAGRLDALPASTARALEQAVEVTAARPADSHLTLAIGYGGRAEVVDAVRSLLVAASTAGESASELADRLTTDDIAAHLYTNGQPEPDLVIRTSGEQRLSDFLLWQTTGSHLWFAEVYWPGFREVDLLRAVRSWADGRRGGA